MTLIIENLGNISSIIALVIAILFIPLSFNIRVVLMVIYAVVLTIYIIILKKKEGGASSAFVIVLLLATYLTLTPLMGSWTNEGNQWFDKYINCSKKQNISFDDIVLVDIPYPDIITFRRNVGVFLEKLAGMKPKAVGLDIIFRKFDCSDQNEMRDSTQKLLGGLKAIERAEIPLIAGYDPKKPRDYYEESIIGETSPLTNSGHTMLEIDDYGGIHARVHEDIKLDSPTSRREQKIFFPREFHPSSIRKNFPFPLPLLTKRAIIPLL